MVGSSKRLAQALQDAGAPPSMYARALLGYYDDFSSPIPYPKIALVDHLEACELHALACRVIAGEFDATREEAEAFFQEKRERLREWTRIRKDMIS